MTKIAVVTVGPPSNQGGAEVVWKNISKEINFDNYSIQDINKKNIYTKFPNILHLNEIISSKKIWNKIKNKKYDLIIYDKILGCSFNKSNKIKIAYAQGLYTPAGLKFKSKNYIIYILFKYLISYFEKKSYQNADYIFSVSKSVTNELINLFKINKNKIITINNGVDHKKFYKINNIVNLKEKYNLSSDKLNILFPARPSFGKGMDIIEKISKTYNQINIIIPSNKNYTKNNLQYIAKVPSDKMIELYNIADLIILPSKYEGNSLSVLEAAACKKPILVSNTGLYLEQHPLINKYVCKNFNDYKKNINLFLENKKKLEIASQKWYLFSKEYTLKKQITDFKKNIKMILNEAV